MVPPDRPRAVSTPDLHVGPYRLVSRLGVGGMAETFEAVREGPGGFSQRVCVKRILPVLEKEQRFVKMFLKEARTAAGLRHKNIVQVIDFGESDGSHFLVLELIDGMDLRQVLALLGQRGENLTSGLVCHLAFELGAALHYAHKATPEGKIRGVVHRDISPSNVLISAEGEIKLADFGIAKAMNVTQISESGAIKGKIPYMAQEYAMGGEYDARTDIFALGVTLYECIAGVRPFQGKREVETLRLIQEGDFVPLGTVIPTTPPELCRVVDKCLSKDPNDRFSNMEALLDALVDAAPPPTASRIWSDLVRSLKRQSNNELLGNAKTLVAEDTATSTQQDQSPPWAMRVSAPEDPTRTSPVADRSPAALPAPQGPSTVSIAREVTGLKKKRGASCWVAAVAFLVFLVAALGLAARFALD